jgi:F-type H+-transporting ATPase subunit b
MLFDWFTVIAQVINFLVLVWLLKHFLYAPILNAIDSREKNIADTLADASQQKSKAKAEYETFNHKNAELEATQQEIMAKAVKEAEQERQRLNQQALAEMNALQQQLKLNMERDITELQQSICQQIQQQIFTICRKLLTELADEKLEAQLIKRFLQQLNDLTPDAKKTMSIALSTSEKAVIQSAFELSADQRDNLTNALNKVFDDSQAFSFEHTPKLVSGISLRANGQKLEWNISDYLKALEQSIQAISLPNLNLPKISDKDSSDAVSK